MTIPKPSREWMRQLQDLAGKKTVAEARRMLMNGGVAAVMVHPAHAAAVVVMKDGGAFHPTVAWQAGMLTTCTCAEDAPCSHVVALALSLAAGTQACIAADTVAKGIDQLTEWEAKRLLRNSCELHPDTWRRLNPPVADEDGTFRMRMERAWMKDADGTYDPAWHLGAFLDDTMKWDLRPGGGERMLLILDIFDSILDACAAGVEDAASMTEGLRLECLDRTSVELEALGDDEAEKGLMKSMDMLCRDSFGLRMDRVVLEFSAPLGAARVIAAVGERAGEGGAPAAWDEGWMRAFTDEAKQIAASAWPEGDRDARAEEAIERLDKFCAIGLTRRYEMEAALEAISILPRWKVMQFLDRMRSGKHRKEWFSVLISADPYLALALFPEVREMEPDMLSLLMISLEPREAAGLGAGWAEERLRAGGTKRQDVVRALAAARKLGGPADWAELKAGMMSRAANAGKVAAALREAEERADGS